MGQAIHTAMIGCGGYAGYLMERLEEISQDCRLVAVTTRRPHSDAARTFRDRGIAVYPDADHLFAALTPEECPAVIIPTSIDSHLDYAEKAVGHGFHVLLEKPPAAMIQDTQRLIDLQRSSGKWIAVNFQHLYNPLSQLLKKRLADGEFGAVRAVRAHALWTRPESYFSRSCWSGRLRVDEQWVLDGTIGNPLAHLLAESLYLATRRPGMAEPQSVRAELYRANDIESEDTSCLCLKTTENVPVLFCASLCSETQTPVVCEIETERALIRIEDYFYLTIRWKDDREETSGCGELDHHLDRRLMLQSILQSLARNERPLITVEDCLPFMRAWNGSFESAGLPRVISAAALQIADHEEDPVRCIPSIDRLCESVCRDGKLFSEQSVEWAAETPEVSLDGYDRFPSLNSTLKGLE